MFRNKKTAGKLEGKKYLKRFCSKLPLNNSWEEENDKCVLLE